MATIDQITSDVNNGKLLSIQRAAAATVSLKSGINVDSSIKNINALKRLIKAITYQINANVINADTNILYTCLLNQLNGFGGNYVIDPTVQTGLSTTVVINGTQLNSGKIQFTNANPIQLLDYQSVYAPIYGNNPVVNFYLSGFIEADQTPPDIVYETADDPTSNILSISWDFGGPVSGYVQILGVMPSGGTYIPGGGGTGGGGSGSTSFTFADTDLVSDGTGGYYLPLTGVPSSKRPTYVESNQIQLVGLRYNGRDYTPARLYGFADNTGPQVIKVIVS